MENVNKDITSKGTNDLKSDEPKEFRLWKFIEFTDTWQTCDTSIIDDISPSWFTRREKLKDNSTEYSDFLDRLKREHAIETGVIERLYDLKKGITETFIKKGFVESYLSHDDTNVPTHVLMKHLKDHLDAVDFVFDVVKDNRFLSTSFIKELHQLVTRHQDNAEGRDSTGTKVKIALLKGEYKTRENNPTREDGTLIRYCPPEHVAAEMDRLVEIHNQLLTQKEHPVIISAWVHHAFTTIHPFQDGNGRVGRLLASLILIKANLFPFTVLREEAREKYIDALEAADKGEPQNLVNYFCDVQKRNIEKALNLKEVSETTFSIVSDIIGKKLKERKEKKHIDFEIQLDIRRNQVFQYCEKTVASFGEQLKNKLNRGLKLHIDSSPFGNNEKQHFYQGQIIRYAIKHHYFFNRDLPKAWVMFKINLEDEKKYQIGFTLHHFGYDSSALAIGAFLESRNEDIDERIESAIPLEIKPHIISILTDVEPKLKNIGAFIEHVIMLSLAQIASEL